jgi:hypothetical protein
MKIALITGASSGIGWEAALEIDRRFRSLDEIWIVGRNEEKLRILSKHLHHANRIIIMDVTNPEDMDAFEGVIKDIKPNIRMLFQSAGEGLQGRFDELPRKEVTNMVRLNCEALTHITSICLPYMKAGSKIINLASSAGYHPMANFGVYCASKAYVLSFSKSLRKELKKRRIGVTAVCPGPVDTPFFTKSERYSGKTIPFKQYIMNKPRNVAIKAICDAGINCKVSVDTPLIALFCVFSKFFF